MSQIQLNSVVVTEQRPHNGQQTTWLRWWCLGCLRPHSVPVSSSGTEPGHWSWNGSLEKPTLSPSIRHFISKEHVRAGADQTICHYYIENGEIRYCGDCQHKYNGQVVALSTTVEQLQKWVNESETAG